MSEYKIVIDWEMIHFIFVLVTCTLSRKQIASYL